MENAICYDGAAALIALYLGFCLSCIGRPSIAVNILRTLIKAGDPKSKGHSR